MYAYCATINPFSLLESIIMGIFSPSYVDPTRMISVGGIGKGDPSGGDLKAMIRTNKLLRESEEEKNSANDAMFIKQAEHMVRSSQFEAAIKYIYKALEMNPESVVRIISIVVQEFL